MHPPMPGGSGLPCGWRARERRFLWTDAVETCPYWAPFKKSLLGSTNPSYLSLDIRDLRGTGVSLSVLKKRWGMTVARK